MIEWRTALQRCGFITEVSIYSHTASRIRQRVAHMKKKRQFNAAWYWVWFRKDPTSCYECSRTRRYKTTTNVVGSDLNNMVPYMPAHMKLHDADGNILRPQENHPLEWEDIIRRFARSDEHILTFCSGTCPELIPALKLGHSISLVERDYNLLKTAISCG